MERGIIAWIITNLSISNIDTLLDHVQAHIMSFTIVAYINISMG